MKRFVLSSGSKYIALDNASGGYPYKVEDIFRAKIWYKLQDAKTYMTLFEKENWSIIEITGVTVVTRK